MITNLFFINKFVFFSRHGNQNFFVREHIIGTEITLRSVLYSSQPIKLQIFLRLKDKDICYAESVQSWNISFWYVMHILRLRSRHFERLDIEESFRHAKCEFHFTFNRKTKKAIALTINFGLARKHPSL